MGDHRGVLRRVPRGTGPVKVGEFSLAHKRNFVLLIYSSNEKEMEEGMPNQRRSTWRERLQIAAQIAALISCMCGVTIAYYAHLNSQRAQAPAATPQTYRQQ